MSRETHTILLENLETVMIGQRRTLRWLLAAFVAGGHVLLEDLPGTGKTTLAKAFARSLTLEFQRIQFTPDLLPSDLLGVSIFDPQRQEFRLHRGPAFTEVLLADEINRASPRTQAALLEAMGERQISLDGQRHELGAWFFVIATQNPIEFHGTYPLPEAQMDRFAMRFGLGYPDVDGEMAMLMAQRERHPLEALHACIDRVALEDLRQAATAIRISDEVSRYLVELVAATRKAPGVTMGASPRASLMLMKIARVLALFDGLDFVTPDHIQELALPVLAHRLKLDSQAQFGGLTAEMVAGDVLRQVATPV
ncbi:MAG: MoxR family ATPase [Gammaproteobacteria bacterium]|nr:MoxR family ATPase [Gammaproteobacteria bacterium]MCP5196570.1 MoxR family ATPase [Gammaproteobacteria bacterium]